jgi:uncharacterized protein with HEPN domain
MKIAAEGIVKSTSGASFEDYLNDENLRLATERRIEIIGEAANRVSGEFKTAHPEIPWRSIIAQRNVLAHDYADIDDRLIWAVVTKRIPELIAKLEELNIELL